MRIYGSVALDGALFRKYSLRAGFDVYPPSDRKVVSMGDVLPDEARVLGYFRTALENWAAKRKLTTWAALDECHRGFLSRRVFMDRCAELGLPGADKAFRMLDVKGKGTLTAKDVAELKKWDAYNDDGTKRTSMLEGENENLVLASLFPASSLAKNVKKDAMDKLISSQIEEKKHVQFVRSGNDRINWTSLFSDGMSAPSDPVTHAKYPKRKCECKACAASLAAEDAVRHPVKWIKTTFFLTPS